MSGPALFTRDGDDYRPTELAVGPWDPNALHGGPPAALLGGAIERHDTDPGAFHVARLTVEILRPVPLTPLAVAVRTVRPGKKVQLLEGALAADGVELVRATAVRIRRADVDVGADLTEPAPPDLPDGDTTPAAWQWDGFFNRGVSMRYTLGLLGTPGPATVWIRLNQPVVEGEDVTPLQRAAAAADFGNGVSAMVPFGTAVFVNPDLTIYLHRPPTGEWVCIEASTQMTGSGVGLAEAALYDTHGRIGRSIQSVFIDRR